jgi:hypothetical protein
MSRTSWFVMIVPLGLAAAGAEARGSEPSAPQEVVSVIHLHSNRSGGTCSPLEIARAARAAGVDALFTADHYLARVTYAPWPIGNVLGFSISRPSVMGVGIERYLEELALVESEVEELRLVPGLEVAPHARWIGSALNGTLQLRGWHRHILVLGVDDADDLGGLPVSGNRIGGIYSAWSLAYLVPAAILIWSVALLAPSLAAGPGPNHHAPRGRGTAFALIPAMASFGILIAGFPYRVERFSPLAPDPGPAPFQHLVDHVRSLGGLTILAHPEAGRDRMEAFDVRMLTEPHPELLRLTTVDGFAALPKGTDRMLPPGGVWDAALTEYLDGSRANAPWAIAENDDHGAAEEMDFNLLQTVLWVADRDRAGLLEALRNGRHYARWTPPRGSPLHLRRWRIESGGAIADSGESLPMRGLVSIRMQIEGGDGRQVTARLVRSGQVIWSRRATLPIETVIEDEPGVSSFYRLDVEGAYPYRLISNPIFVTGRREPS